MTNKFSFQIINKLFAQNGSFGMDLIALNIQRGRDHGLPSYTEWRSACQLPSVKTFNKIPFVRTFNDLSDVMTQQASKF